MTRFARCLLSRVLGTATVLACVLTAAGQAGHVWTVGGINPDFPDIQPAVLAAKDGDIVLVRPGTYTAFAIFDQSLTVAGRSQGNINVLGQIRVQGLSAGKRVALIDLHVSGNGEHALRLADNLGSVRVVGGTWKGTDLPPGSWQFVPSNAVYASTCADLSFEGSTLLGGKGWNAKSMPLSAPGPGGHGLRALECNVALHGSTLHGGDGGSDLIGESYSGAKGGSGALLEGGFLHAAAAHLAGGKGGAGSEEDGIPPFMNSAKNGGDGGHGLWLVGSAVGPAHGELLDSTALGGAGGSGGQGYYGPNGAPGAAGLPVAVSGNATYNLLPGTARRLSAPGVWRVGFPLQVSLQGQPGEMAFMLHSPQTGFTPSAAKQGVVLLGGLPGLEFAGHLPASGTLTRTIIPKALHPGFEGATLFQQAWTTNPVDGIHLTDPLTVVLVQPWFF